MKNHKIIPMSLILILFMGWMGAIQTLAETRDTLERQYATGVVFHDKNENGILDSGEKGISKIRVSNGREVVETDRKGQYNISVTEDTIVFVIKPKGWITPFNENQLPKFYYIHKPQGSPALEYKGVKPTGPLPDSINFPLYPHREPKRFQTVFLGDTQVYNQEQLNFLAHDSVEELVGIDAAFGVTLGDNVGDRLSLMKPLSKTIGRIGIPWYTVIGNHDRNYDAPNFDSRDDTFERVFGPSVYSYDWGEVHFINLNNIFSLEEKWRYKGRLTQKILDYIRNDLAFVPPKKLIVLMMHIPLSNVENAEDLYRLIEDRPHTFSISAHYHTQQHLFIGEKQGWKGKEPHHHLINVTSCGSWWQGAWDEVGIPHSLMADGAPKGYSLITFDGNQYSIRYKASRRPVDYQMNIFAPEAIKAEEASKTEVLVNVFAGSERSKVEIRLGEEGPWTAMKQVKRKDPYLLAINKLEESSNPPTGKKLTNAKETNHLWKATLPKQVEKGTQLIHVRTTDMFEQTYTDCRIIRIE